MYSFTRKEPSEALAHFPLGSVSTGTLRTEDLISACLTALDLVADWRTTEGVPYDSPDEVALVGQAHDLAGGVERRMDDEGYFDSEEADYDLEALQDTVEELCPQGVRFGGHEGDPADVGFWLHDEDA